MRHSSTYLLIAALFASACGGCLGACAPESARPNVILITLDTTRADRLSAYGYERETSPNLDRLAAEATRYEHAYSVSSWTLPAHATLFTGKFPTSHGARYDPYGPLKLTSGLDGPASWDRFRARGLDAGETTLASLLTEHGYATGAVVAGPWMMDVFGLSAGFEHYDDTGIDSLNGRRAADVTDAALEWIGAVPDSKPFFLFLNYYDPHGPYDPPESYKGRFLGLGVEPERDLTEAQWRDSQYDAEILYMDEQLGRLFEDLRSRGIYDETCIVVTADHGELLGEKGEVGHGKTLTQAEIHIPLIWKDAQASPSGRVETTPIQQTDVLPMLADRLGLPISSAVQGGKPPTVGHPIIAEVHPLAIMTRAGDWETIIEGDFKFAWNSLGRHALYNIKTDHGESTNLIRKDPERAQRLEELLRGYLATLPRPATAGTESEVEEEVLEKLRNLGYIR